MEFALLDTYYYSIIFLQIIIFQIYSFFLLKILLTFKVLISISVLSSTSNLDSLSLSIKTLLVIFEYDAATIAMQSKSAPVKWAPYITLKIMARQTWLVKLSLDMDRVG